MQQPSSHSLREHLLSIKSRFKKWRTEFNPGKINASESNMRFTSTSFNYRRQMRRLTRNPYTGLKRTDTKRDNPTSLSKPYQTNIPKPIWTYTLELWGSAKPSNSLRIRTLQSITVRKITNDHYYVSDPFARYLASIRHLLFHSELESRANLAVGHGSSPHTFCNPKTQTLSQLTLILLIILQYIYW